MKHRQSVHLRIATFSKHAHRYIAVIIACFLAAGCITPSSSSGTSPAQTNIPQEVSETKEEPVIETENIAEKTKAFEGMLEIGVVTDTLADGRMSAFGKLELGIELRAHVTNPYDPSDISIYARFVSPDKKSITIPGFYMIPHAEQKAYGRTAFRRSGEGTWKVRFTPSLAGTWSYTVHAEQKAGKADGKAVSFTVEPKKASGFVRAQKGGRYFVFDSGDTYLPIGSNVCWYRSGSGGFEAYEEWFSRMSANGANYARIWLASWGFAQEWSDTGLGNYDARQTQAAELDALFALAEKYGMYLMICLVNHGQFSTTTNSEWAANPYNSAAGGMCETPADFLTNDKARELFKRKLRYISSRWGYDTHLFSWEWWNEVDLTDGLSKPSLLVPWMREMRAYIESIEPYGHLVTSSWSGPINGRDEYWTDDVLDFAQVHSYNKSDWRDYMFRQSEDLLPVLGRPLLFGEFGVNSESFIDPNGIHFHDGLYSGIFSGSAGTGMIWWWDTYIDPKNLYYHYKGLSEFFKGEASFLPATKPVTVIEPYDNDLHFGGHALSGPDRTYVWVRSNFYSYGYFTETIIGTGVRNFKFPVVKGAPVKVRVAKPGAYRVEIWDPAKAGIIHSGNANAAEFVEIRLPDFTEDLLVKIFRQ